MTNHYRQMLIKCFDPDLDFETFRSKFNQNDNLPMQRCFITNMQIERITIEVCPELDSLQCFELVCKSLKVDMLKNAHQNNQSLSLASFALSMVTKTSLSGSQSRQLPEMKLVESVVTRAETAAHGPPGVQIEDDYYQLNRNQPNETLIGRLMTPAVVQPQHQSDRYQQTVMQTTIS